MREPHSNTPQPPVKPPHLLKMPRTKQRRTNDLG